MRPVIHPESFNIKVGEWPTLYTTYIDIKYDDRFLILLKSSNREPLFQLCREDLIPNCFIRTSANIIKELK